MRKMTVLKNISEGAKKSTLSILAVIITSEPEKCNARIVDRRATFRMKHNDYIEKTC